MARARDRCGYTWRQTLLIGVVSLAMGGGICFLTTHNIGIPPASSLAVATGTVDWVRRERYAITFGLQGQARAYRYSSKANAMGLVLDRLAGAGRQPVRILYDAVHPSGPVWSDDKYNDIYELSVGGVMVRSHANMAAAYAADDRLGYWLGGAFVVAGLGVLGYGVFGWRPA